MQKGKELIKKPIILNDNSRIFSKISVKNLIFNHKTNQLLGFLLDCPNNAGQEEVLLFEQVKAIAPHGIVAPSPQGPLSPSQTQHIQEAVEQKIVLEGRPVVTPEGEYLGDLQDLYFDPHTGKIEGYEVAPLSDRPKQFIQAVTIDQGLENSVALMQSPDVREVSKPSLSETISGALAQAKPLSLTLSSSPSAKPAVKPHSKVKPFSGRHLERAKGRRVRHAVYDRQGRAIAIPGQIVTQCLLEKAQKKGYGTQLCAAVGLDTTELVNNQSHKSPRGNRNSSKRQTDRRVKQALGHPVTRTIVDDQNRVILNVGDLITYHAVDRARKAKVLPALLNSVYRSPYSAEGDRSRRKRHR